MHRKFSLRHSIQAQMSTIFILLIIGTVALCWILNSCFLGDYYINKKEKSLKAAYKSINDAVETGQINTEAYDIELETICAKYNLSLLIIDEKTATVKSSLTNSDVLWRQLLNHVFFQEEWEKGDSDTSGDLQMREVASDYKIQIGKDYKTDSKYIEMWGELNNQNLFIIRSPLDSIKDSVFVANQFLVYTGGIGILLSILISFFIANKVTNPVKELTHVSEQMKNLDFDIKYTGKEENEIGALGKNINELSETLERTISELKTANNELQNDLDKKIKIDEMRKEFVSNVSHELKTPIALIQGYAEGLKEGITDDPDSMEFYCDVIIDETAKMNSMVKKLLTLTQLEYGKDQIVMERFDIAELIKNYVNSISILVRQQEAKISISGLDSCYVWADEFKIEEVVMNYISNALNHLDANKIVDIKIKEVDKKIRVSVFNTGEPIPEESIDRVWDKFYKVDKARTREYGGSGVGLSIVKVIMEAMNQKYGVENFENGVMFWFELDKA